MFFYKLMKVNPDMFKMLLYSDIHFVSSLCHMYSYCCIEECVWNGGFNQLIHFIVCYGFIWSWGTFNPYFIILLMCICYIISILLKSSHIFVSWIFLLYMWILLSTYFFVLNDLPELILKSQELCIVIQKLFCRLLNDHVWLG